MKIEEVFQKLKPLAGPEIDKIWLEYLLADSKTRKVIEDSLRVMLAKNLEAGFEERQILLPPPPREKSTGDYPLGEVFYGDAPQGYGFGLTRSEMTRHLSFYGITGAGKSLAAMSLALKLMEDGVPLLVLDWKRNWRDLLSLTDREILVFSIGGEFPFFFNPLIPPEGTSANTWMKKLVEVMGHAYYLGFGVFDIMEEAIDQLYSEFGVYSGKPSSYPTMRDVYEYLKNLQTKGRRAEWMDSTMRAIRKLTVGDVARTFNQRTPFPIHELLKRNVILELDNLTDADKVFFIEALLLFIHRHRMAEPGEREVLKHAIVLEEAHHVLSKMKTLATGTEAITDVIFREIREYGESLWVIDQEPALVSVPSMNNCFTTVAMNSKHQKNVEALGSAMLMDTRQRKYLGRLETGWGIAKLQGRWPEPLLVKFPLLRIKKGSVTDENVKEKMKSFYGRYSEVFREEGEISEHEREEREVFRDFRGAGKREEKSRKTRGELAKFEELLLRDIVKEQFSPTSERYTRLGLNSYQGNKAKDSLVARGIVEVKDMATRTGRIRLLLLTEKGKEFAESMGLNPNVSHRKGGLEHEYWKKRLADYYREKGYRVVEEYPIGQGKTVDLVAMKDGKRLAIEIETGKSDAVYNIRKNLEAGFDKVVCVVLSKKVLGKIVLENYPIGSGKINIISVDKLERVLEG